MQTPKPFRNSRQNETEWDVLVEYSLRGRMIEKDSGDNLSERRLYQTILEFGIPLDCLNEIKRTMSDIIKEVMGKPNQGGVGLPVHIRLLCQKSITEDPEGHPKDHAIKPTYRMQHPEAKISGGWGYFLIERNEYSTAGSSGEAHNCVDLYLYKEGE